MKSSVRINLLSGPRNISTALMYSFAQRSDCTVFDEPLYAYYLANSNAKSYHPGAEEILKSQENDGAKVVEMMKKETSKPVLFFKNMSHHILDLDRSFMKNMVNVILTRDPMEMLPSFDKVIPNPKMKDVGYELHMNLYESLKSMGAKVLVLDSKKVLLNPEETLNKLCAAIGIPFESRMLNWKPGPIKEDGVWAKHWYDSVHKSSGFMKYKPKTESFPSHLEVLLSKCKVYYDNLLLLSL